jgi:ferredoxin-type protein NapH
MKRQRIRRKLVFFSFLLLPVTLNYFSPYLMTSGTAERVASASLLVWATIFASSLVLGRSFCGWLCPFHGLQLAWEKVADKPLKRVRYLPAAKYVLWGAWAAGVAAVAVMVRGWTHVDPLYSTPYVVSIEGPQSLVIYFTLIGVTLAPAALGRRSFCLYFCPFGVWSIVGSKLGGLARIPSLRLRADASACNSCRRCDRECPMSLPVADMASAGDMRATECLLCGSCVDSCPRKALRYGFGRP